MQIPKIQILPTILLGTISLLSCSYAQSSTIGFYGDSIGLIEDQANTAPSGFVDGSDFCLMITYDASDAVVTTTTSGGSEYSFNNLTISLQIGSWSSQFNPAVGSLVIDNGDPDSGGVSLDYFGFSTTLENLFGVEGVPDGGSLEIGLSLNALLFNGESLIYSNDLFSGPSDINYSQASGTNGAFNISSRDSAGDYAWRSWNGNEPDIFSSVAIVPEPSSTALLGLGVLGLTLRRRR